MSWRRSGVRLAVGGACGGFLLGGGSLVVLHSRSVLLRIDHDRFLEVPRRFGVASEAWPLYCRMYVASDVVDTKSMVDR